jgi:prepilin signal peptidase PulO-like enzyme (type II secretory pathway)
MTIGLTVSLLVLIVGIFVNYKIRRKPELLDRDDSEKD